jgi:hypothetical protein
VSGQRGEAQTFNRRMVGAAVGNSRNEGAELIAEMVDR